MSTSGQKQNGSEQEQQKEQSEEQLEAVTQELGALKAQHEQSLLRHESSVSEYDDSLKQHSADNTQLKEDMAASQTQLAAAEQQLVQSRAAADKLKEQFQAKATAAEETASKVRELQRQVQSQQPESQHAEVVARDEKLQSLPPKNSQLEQEAVELKSQLDQSRQQVSAILFDGLVTWVAILTRCCTLLPSTSTILQQQATSYLAQYRSTVRRVFTQPILSTLLQPCSSGATQVQQAKDALSEERSSAQKSRDALTVCQLLLAEASSGQKELQSQCADLQLQADEAAAQSSSLQSALIASEGKLADSETELAETRSHVSTIHSVMLTAFAASGPCLPQHVGMHLSCQL
ncbi:hypothetical protein ABBQ32_003476 [Trebouxia sp. C0010 RCD-2024]